MFASSDGNNGKGGDWFASVPIFELQYSAVGSLCGPFQMARWDVWRQFEKRQQMKSLLLVMREEVAGEMTGTSSKIRGMAGKE